MPVDSLASARLALDVKGLDSLKRAAVKDPKSQLKEAARQFEAVFLANMLKSMREATVKSDLVDNRQLDFYQSMLDQQLSQQMAGKGPGLAQLLVRQLSRQAGAQPDAQGAATAAQLAAIPSGTPRSLAGVPAVTDDDVSADSPVRRSREGGNPVPSGSSGNPEAQSIADVAARVRDDVQTQRMAAAAMPAAASASASPLVSRVSASAPADDDSAPGRFVSRFVGAARAAAERSGLPALLILAQAALETGWGRHEVATTSGANSHNLFGIKAGAGWNGATATSQTSEFVAGQWTRVQESFRAYRSYLDSFIDHARLIGSSPRYAAVQTAQTPEQAARALQDCGYATDPAYADKLISIMQQISRSGVM